MKAGVSMRDGPIELTTLANSYHEGVYVRLPIGFGISGSNRLNAKGNVARPTRVTKEVLSQLVSCDNLSLVVKYAGTPVYWTTNPRTERQIQKNNALTQICALDTLPQDHQLACYECFGAGIFGINDPIGLGKKFERLLSNTIIAIDVNRTERKHVRGYITLGGRNIRVIIGAPRKLTQKQVNVFKIGLTNLLEEVE